MIFFTHLVLLTTAFFKLKPVVWLVIQTKFIIYTNIPSCLFPSQPFIKTIFIELQRGEYGIYEHDGKIKISEIKI